MQKTIDCWAGVAKSTGGALKLSKSWWYLIHFNWDASDWLYRSTNNILFDTVTGPNKDGDNVELKFVKAETAQKMLGVYLAPDRNDKKQIQEMKKITTQLGEMVQTGHLDRYESWTALNRVAQKNLNIHCLH